MKRLLLAVLLAISFACQAAVYSLPWGPKPQFVDANGAPMSGATLQTFVGGSTTPQVTYTDSTGGVANPTTITLNVRGETPNEVWLTGGVTYKFVLKDSGGSTVWTVDNLSGVNDATNVLDEWKSGPTPTFVSATSFTLAGDQTTTFTVGRRVKTTNSGGTIYSTITTSAFVTSTTVTVVNDSGVLDSGLSAVSYGILSAANSSIPSVKLSAGAWTISNALTASNTFQLSGIVSPAQITSNQNDYSPTGLSTASVARLNTDASRNITSIAGGASGRVLSVLNVGSFNIVLRNDDGATGTAANRLQLGGDVVLFPDHSATLYYDSTTSRWRLWDTTALRQHGKSYLSKSGANLQLCPKEGNTIVVNARVETIPDACITVGVGGLSASTSYFIYTFMSSGTMTLEAVVTAHATQAGTGVEIKSGDATRTLVGMGRTNGSTAWEDDSSLIGVSSYFNRRNKGIQIASGSSGTSSGSYVEIGVRCNFVTWADESVIYNGIGSINNSSGGTVSTVGIGVDVTNAASTGTETLWNTAAVGGAGGLFVPYAVNLNTSLSEGFHFITTISKVSSGAATVNPTSGGCTVRG